jgi:glucokinase
VSQQPLLVLAADVGATTTRLGIYSVESGPRAAAASRTVATTDYASIEQLVGEFLSAERLDVEAAVLAVAGPVRDGVVVTDTLPWSIDQDELLARLGVASLRLMNDVEAVAWAVPLLEPDDVVTLREGKARPSGAVAVIGLGTGLGEAFLVATPTGYVDCESEGGHTAFAPSSDEESELLRLLGQRSRYVSYEMVCSGMALPDLYAFVRSRSTEPEPEELSARLASAADRTRVIVDTALSGAPGSVTCLAAVELLVSILGAEAGNFALTVSATGGFYLGGGMPSRILPLLRSGQFLERFGSKGRDSAFLNEIPVHVITNTLAGLIGAAATGLDAIRS